MKIKTNRVCTAVGMSLMLAATVRADQAAPSSLPEKSYTGTVAAVDPQEHTLKMQGVFVDKKFNVGDNCSYVLPDNNAGTFGDLRPGEKITVSYQDNQGVLVADHIEQLPLLSDGVVRAIDPARHTLTIHLRALDKDFQIAGDCRVMLRNDKTGALTDIQPGDHVTVTYEEPNGQPTAREIAQTSVVFTGSLVAIDLPERTVKAREGFSTKKFNLADNCVIVINGKTDGRLDDLKPDERLVFKYDEINGVNVVNRIVLAEASPNSMVTTSSAP